MRNKSNKQGFSLIEVILSVAIIAIILQIVNSVFIVGNRSFIMSKNKGFAQQDLRIVSQYITKELTTASSITLEKPLTYPHYSLSLNNDNKLIKKTYSDIGTAPSINIITSPIALLTFYRLEGTTDGIIKVTISDDEDNSYFINFDIFLENLNSFAVVIDPPINTIYYTKYE